MKIKFFFINLLIISYLTPNCALWAQDKTAFNLFKKYLVGNFDNAKQIKSEKMAGKQIHPYARHVNRVFDPKIKNIPPDFQGVFILEESYYVQPNQSDTLIKPYLFKIEPLDNQSVKLYSMALPAHLDKKTIRNNNPQLSFDFNDLQVSPTFSSGAVYTLKAGDVFYTKTTVQLSSEMRFTLEEYLSKNLLSVMELTEKNGERLTPYDTPILYDRVKKFAK
jgi:hypothetical protein